jgi:hypothetical protein
MRHKTRFEAFAFSEADDRHTPLLAEISSPAQQVSRVFDFQSYFDSTLLENALLRQPTNDPIVSAREEQMPGYAVGLHPSSQTPIAIEFRVGAQKSSSGPLILKPGEFIRPYGLPGGKQGAFSGFRWGLPFGWLGGGLATMKVFQTPDAYVEWPEHAEIIFHRARYEILTPSTVPATIAGNWPMRFPWTQAAFGAVPISQAGDPALAVTPTRAMMVLRLETLAAAADAIAYFQGSNDFGLDSAGAVIAGEVVGVPITFGTRAPLNLTNIATEYQVEDAPSDMMRLSADFGGMALVSDDADIQGAFVDITRYGRL